MGVLLLTAAMVLSIFLVVLGLPGLWVMLGSALVYDWLVPSPGITVATLAVVAALALVAEGVEWVLATRYTAKYGGSPRAGWGAIAGGIVGAMVGLPVPVIGSVIGAFAGAFVGALALELTIAGATHGSAARVAWGAVLGRVAAAVAKAGVGCAMAALILVDAISG